MKQFKKELAAELEETLGVAVDENDIEIPDDEHGDLAYPVMKAASELGREPRKLAEFPGKVDRAVEQREPAKVANYLSGLCEEFNSFYHSSPVIDAEEKTMKRRLRIVELFVDVTDWGMKLLGIEPLEEM